MVQEDVERKSDPRSSRGKCRFHDPGLVMRSFSMRDGESAASIFRGIYFVADNIGSFEDHDAVLWISHIWRMLKAMDDSSRVTFMISCGLTLLYPAFKIGIGRRKIGFHGSNDFLSKYLCSILGSLVLQGDGPKSLKDFWLRVFWTLWYQ